MNTKASIIIDNGQNGTFPFDVLKSEITDEFGENSYKITYEIIGQYNDIFFENNVNQKIIREGQRKFVSLGYQENHLKEEIDQKYFEEAEQFKKNNPEIFKKAHSQVFFCTDDSMRVNTIRSFVLLKYPEINNFIEINDIFISLIKSLAIPVRKAFGYIREDNNFNAYEWAEVGINNKWSFSNTSPNHLKIKSENDFGKESFKLRVSEIRSTVNDFNMQFLTDKEHEKWNDIISS